MKFKTTSTLLALTTLFYAWNAHAAIQEITSMTQILPYVNEQTLLVFDLDNTVIEPVQTLGSDQWFKSLLAGGDTVPQALSLWEQVQKVTQVRAVESITPEIILSAQLQGLKVMALTSRPSDLAPTTENQLRSIGVSFLRSSPYQKDILNPAPDSAQYINGVEYIGPTLSKGEALVEFLNHVGLKPKRIVFVDDTLKHDQTVNASLDQAGIENFEFRYGAADPLVKALNPTSVSAELRVFQQCDGELISDSAALALNQSAFRCP